MFIRLATERTVNYEFVFGIPIQPTVDVFRERKKNFMCTFQVVAFFAFRTFLSGKIWRNEVSGNFFETVSSNWK